MSSVKDKTDKFVEQYGGKVVNHIDGKDGAIAYKVLSNNRMFHIYFSRDWYRKYNGVSIPTESLKIGTGDNATIVIYIMNDCYWQYATQWVLNGIAIKNSMYNTDETLIKKENLNIGNFEKPQNGMDGFL